MGLAPFAVVGIGQMSMYGSMSSRLESFWCDPPPLRYARKDHDASRADRESRFSPPKQRDLALNEASTSLMAGGGGVHKIRLDTLVVFHRLSSLTACPALGRLEFLLLSARQRGAARAAATSAFSTGNRRSSASSAACRRCRDPAAASMFSPTVIRRTSLRPLRHVRKPRARVRTMAKTSPISLSSSLIPSPLASRKTPSMH